MLEKDVGNAMTIAGMSSYRSGDAWLTCLTLPPSFEKGQNFAYDAVYLVVF